MKSVKTKIDEDWGKVNKMMMKKKIGLMCILLTDCVGDLLHAILLIFFCVFYKL